MPVLLKDLPPNFVFRVPYHPLVSERDMHRAAEVWVDSTKRRAKLRDRQAREFAAILHQRAEKLRAFIGGEHYFALEQFKRQLRLEAIGKTKPPHGLGISRAELVRNQNQRVTAFLKERKISPERVRALAAQMFEKLSFPGVDTAGTVEGGVFDPGDPVSPFHTFVPPFTGYASGYTEGTNGYRLERTTFFDPAAGQVGLRIKLDDGDAGDSDFGYSTAGAQVAVWFQAPRTGLVEVIIDAQCGRARHELSVRDEWGFSDQSTSQRHLLLMEVIHPNVSEPSFNLVSELVYHDDDDAFFDEQHLIPGQNFRTQNLVSFGAIPAGAWVVIAAGCQSEDDSKTNDMEIHSRSTFLWFIKRIHVRVLE